MNSEFSNRGMGHFADFGRRIRIYYPTGETEAAALLIALPIVLLYLYQSDTPRLYDLFRDILPYGLCLFVLAGVFLVFFNTRYLWIQGDRLTCANFIGKNRLVFADSMRFDEISEVRFSFTLGSRRRIQTWSCKGTYYMNIWVGPIDDEIEIWRLLGSRLNGSVFNTASLARMDELKVTSASAAR